MSRQRFNLIGAQEAMDLLGVSRATFDRWRKHKGLPHLKIGKEILVDARALETWVRARGAAATADFTERGAGGDDGIGSIGGIGDGGRDRVVTVGYQSGAALLWSSVVIKQLGLFEEELRKISPGRGYRVKWVNAPNGIELVEELIAGRVHIASVGDFPIIAGRALSGILPGFRPVLLAFDGKTSNGGGISLVVPAGQRDRSPGRLTETAVATVGHSSASYRLREWMKDERLDFAPVVKRGMGDVLNGLIDGNVGAAMLWEPYLSWAQSLGAGEPLHGDGIGGDYLTGLMADGRWAAGNEDAIIAYLKAHLRAHAYIRSRPHEAAILVSEGSGFPVSVVAGVLSTITWDASVYGRDLRALRRLSEGQSDWLPSGPANAGDGLPFPTRYLQEAAEALKLPALPDAPLPGEWERNSPY